MNPMFQITVTVGRRHGLHQLSVDKRYWMVIIYLGFHSLNQTIWQRLHHLSVNKRKRTDYDVDYVQFDQLNNKYIGHLRGRKTNPIAKLRIQTSSLHLVVNTIMNLSYFTLLYNARPKFHNKCRINRTLSNYNLKPIQSWKQIRWSSFLFCCSCSSQFWFCLRLLLRPGM